MQAPPPDADTGNFMFAQGGLGEGSRRDEASDGGEDDGRNGEDSIGSMSPGTSEDEEEDVAKLERALGGTDPFTGRSLDLQSDDSGRADVISMIHKVCYSREVDLDANEESSDTTGRYLYLLSCRRNRVRPCAPAAMQMSGQYMLLQHHGLKGAEVVSLSSAIAVNYCLTHLDLCDNSVMDEGAEALAKAFTFNSTIKTLILSSGHIGWKGGLAWAQALEKNTGLTKLDLQKNRLGDRACKSIVDALKKNSFVATLNLADNHLGTHTAVQLREMLMQNKSLTDLDISWNHIRPPDLVTLSQGLKGNSTLKTLSLAWNGIGDKRVEPKDSSPSLGLNQTQKSSKTSSPPRSPRRPVTAGADAGDAIVSLIRQNVGITDLDISSCRLGSHVCNDLASAVAANRSMQYLRLDGNPFGDGAVEIIKALKARMLDGSLYKFSMDNCCFDPIKRNIEYDHNCPSGYYKLDLADAKDREICKKLLLECKTRRQDIFRNEKLDEKRISLTKALVCGGYDGNWKGWEPPPQGILEVDVTVQNHPDTHTCTIHSDDFRILTRAMESTGNDSAKIALLKQAVAAYWVDSNQAMMLLLQFGRDASRELALIHMFAVMVDRKNLFHCHAALSDRSKFDLHKRLGALYMMNRTEPGGRYWFDLAKGDDQRALRLLLQIKKTDPESYFDEVRFAEQCAATPLDILPGTDWWTLIFAENFNALPGTPERILDRGILELHFHAKSKGDALRKCIFQSAAQPGKTSQRPGSHGRPGSSWGKGGRDMSKTYPQGPAADVLTIDSRPNTVGAQK